MYALRCGLGIDLERPLLQNEMALYWQSNPVLFGVDPLEIPLFERVGFC